MPERAWVGARRVGILPALVLLGGGTTALAAQQDPFPGADPHAARAAAVQARIDSLTPLLERAQQRASQMGERRRREALRRSISGTDTVRVGPLRVVVLTGRGGQAEEHFRAVWDEYRPMLGGVEPESLRDHLFGFQHELELRDLDLPPGSSQIRERAWRTNAAVRGAVRYAVGAALLGPVPGPQRDWMASMPIGHPPSWGWVRRELLLTRSRAADRCRLGEQEECWSAMGALSAADPLAEVRAWYREAERRQRAEAFPRGAEWTRCVGGNVSSCDALLARDRARAIPLDPRVRGSLAMLALEMGGEGALARFWEPLPAGSELRDHLARTAGTTSDQLMAEWHRRVMAAAPVPAGPDRSTRMLTLTWILLFAGLAARSTRWRFS